MGMTISDISGVIQGLGSLAAVAAAVGIYWRQVQERRADEKAEIAAFVQAVRDEISTLLGLYDRQIGPALRALEPGQAFNFFYPVSVDALTFYNSAASYVGKVSDPELRRLIVESYAIARGLIGSFQMNNHLLSEYQSLLIHYRQNDREKVLQEKAQGLVAYAADLKGQGDRVSTLVASLLSRIDVWLQRKQ
jgi:hypothetical protein